MRIGRISIENFRSIIKSDIVLLDMLALIGRNSVGKSNILYAIDFFLSKNKAESIYDFHDSEKPITIEMRFEKLNEYESEKLNEHVSGDGTLTIRKRFAYDPTLEEFLQVEATSIKDGSVTGTPPRGLTNVLSETLPEPFFLPAVRYSSEEEKVSSNLGKFLKLLLQTSDFSKLEELIQQWNDKMQECDADAPLQPLINAAEEISNTLQKQFRASTVRLRPKELTKSDLLKSIEIHVDDGNQTPLTHKGHGLQRAFLFSILKLWSEQANKQRVQDGKEKKGIMLLIEEPELYLHPQQQRVVYNLLQSISSEEHLLQVIYTTHSSFMVHVEDYKNIGFVRCEEAKGTTITQVKDEMFPSGSDDKNEFTLQCQFDPERNELFFADTIVLVEGDTEKMSLPLILNKIGIDHTKKDVSIIECGSKAGLQLFIQFLRTINEQTRTFKFIVLHDRDIPCTDYEDEQQKKQREQQAQVMNTNIESLCSTTPLYVFEPDFERELHLELAKKHKPYKAYRQIANWGAHNIPDRIKSFLTEHLL